MANNVVAFAREVLDMQERIGFLEWEVCRLKEYEQKYRELLGSNLEHNQRMVGQTLRLLMTPGVADAIEAARQ